MFMMVFFQAGNETEAKLIVVSISVQPVLSLAARYALEPQDAFRRLSGIVRISLS